MTPESFIQIHRTKNLIMKESVFKPGLLMKFWMGPILGGQRPPAAPWQAGVANFGRSWELGISARTPQCKHCLGNIRGIL